MEGGSHTSDSTPARQYITVHVVDDIIGTYLLNHPNHALFGQYQLSTTILSNETYAFLVHIVAITKQLVQRLHITTLRSSMQRSVTHRTQ
jgi:hypothetical protein